LVQQERACRYDGRGCESVIGWASERERSRTGFEQATSAAQDVAQGQRGVEVHLNGRVAQSQRDRAGQRVGVVKIVERSLQGDWFRNRNTVLQSQNRPGGYGRSGAGSA